MKRLGFSLEPMVTAAGILALSGVAMAQREGDAKGWMGGMSHELMASANCPQIQVTKEKITEDQARDFAQQYADKNLAGFQGSEAAWLRRRVSDRVLQDRQPGDRKASILLFGRVFHRHAETQRLRRAIFASISSDTSRSSAAPLTLRANAAQQAQSASRVRKVQPDQRVHKLWLIQ